MLSILQCSLPFLSIFLKFVNNSKAKDNSNHAQWHVWISDEVLLDFASLISPSKSVCLRSYIKHLSQCFITISKTSEVGQKYSHTHCIFNSILLIFDETLCLVFDILHKLYFLSYVCTDVKQTMKQLVKRSARPTANDTRRGRVPYEPKKAPPFTLQQMLRMRTYCLKTIEVRIYGLVVWLQVIFS